MRTIKRALITGAGGGIGAAFAEELPASVDLLLAGRNRERLLALQAKLLHPGRQVEICIADLSTPTGVDELIAAAQDFSIDLLINNAGVGRLGRVVDNPPQAERDTVMVNVFAVVALTRALLPAMIARADVGQTRAGVIIVASTAAFAPVPYFATYAASKAFDLSFAEGLAEEMRGQPVDVMALCPGATRTAFGNSAGYDLQNVPGASDPRQVARSALAALGRDTVHVSGGLNQAAFGPVVLPRRLVTGAVGMAMRFLVTRTR